MNQTEAFLAATLPRLRQAEAALHNGDAEPRIALWSHSDPITLFGGVMGGTGWAEIEPIFQRLGASFSNCQSYDIRGHLRRANDDLACTVAYRAHHRLDQWGPPTAYVLRVTTVFHREDGEWKVVHRHADPSASATAGEVLQQLVSSSEPSQVRAPA